MANNCKAYRRIIKRRKRNYIKNLKKRIVENKPYAIERFKVTARGNVVFRHNGKKV